MPIILNKNKKVILKSLNLREFYEKRNKILIVREIGGAGDIMMHRMLFEDIKKQMPDCETHFACPKNYMDLVNDHPYIDKVLDCRQLNYNDYLISYNTSSACGRYEMSIAPFSDLHRSDIWASHIGIKLNNHEMHIHLSSESLEFGERILQEVKTDHTKPAVLISPVSAIEGKNLNNEQVTGLVNGLRMRNCIPYAVHHSPIEILNRLGVRTLYNLDIKKWIGVINSADYIVSVDTATFHIAGGLKKPEVGIFTFADGLVYGKYYPKFELVQKHRNNGDWDCGPCYNGAMCPKTKNPVRPCLSELTSE